MFWKRWQVEVLKVCLIKDDQKLNRKWYGGSPSFVNEDSVVQSIKFLASQLK